MGNAGKTMNLPIPSAPANEFAATKGTKSPCGDSRLPAAGRSASVGVGSPRRWALRRSSGQAWCNCCRGFNRRVRRLVASILIIGLLAAAPAGAQNAAAAPDAAVTDDSEVLAQRWRDLALTTDSDAAFERFIHMAQTGELGADVTNANVGVIKNHARVELVPAPGASRKLFLLTPKDATQTLCRYFNIEPGEGATASDAARVGRALDAAFGEDPFQLAYDFFNAVPGGAALPSLADAWRRSGWSGVLHGLERRTVGLAGLPYTVAVIGALAAALVASLWLLWGAPTESVLEERQKVNGKS